jgi:hypothetical protein
MVIRALDKVATIKEEKKFSDVKWMRFPERAGADPTGGGMITGIWKAGCSLMMSRTVLKGLHTGETIHLQVRDDSGELVLSRLGTVIWNDSRFRADGHRYEIRFRDDLENAELAHTQFVR